MSESAVSKKIKRLPPEAKKQALDFVDFLYERYADKESKESMSTGQSISESSFFGLWKYRKDIQDSTTWVKKIRKTEWTDL